MSKFLNLDSLATQTGAKVQINGKEYPIVELTVQDTINMDKKRNIFAKKEVDSLNADEIFEFSMETIIARVPGVSFEDLKSLTPSKLQALSKFLNEVDVMEEVKEEVKN